jgi:predicted AAA+ superfamily ATPase
MKKIELWRGALTSNYAESFERELKAFYKIHPDMSSAEIEKRFEERYKQLAEISKRKEAELNRLMKALGDIKADKIAVFCADTSSIELETESLQEAVATTLEKIKDNVEICLTPNSELKDFEFEIYKYEDATPAEAYLFREVTESGDVSIQHTLPIGDKVNKALGKSYNKNKER